VTDVGYTEEEIDASIESLIQKGYVIRYDDDTLGLTEKGLKTVLRGSYGR
jgi:hypothetical protein